MGFTPPASFTATRMAADYTKRQAESLWDRIMAGRLGAFLRSLNSLEKHIVELLAYWINAIFVWKVGDATPVRHFVSETIGDMAPELAKRMYTSSATWTHPDANSTTDAAVALQKIRATCQKATKGLAWYIDPFPGKK